MRAAYAGTCKCGCGNRVEVGAEIVKVNGNWILAACAGTVDVAVDLIGGNGKKGLYQVAAHVVSNPNYRNDERHIPGWGWGAADLDEMSNNPPQPCLTLGCQGVAYYRCTCQTWGCPECGERYSRYDYDHMNDELQANTKPLAVTIEACEGHYTVAMKGRMPRHFSDSGDAWGFAADMANHYHTHIACVNA